MPTTTSPTANGVITPLSPPCYFCGPDHLNLPPVTAPVSGSADAIVLIPGCECPGCVRLAALATAPVTADTTPDVPDYTGGMHTIRLTHREYPWTSLGERVTTSVACANCISRLRQISGVATTCQWCSNCLDTDIAPNGDYFTVEDSVRDLFTAVRTVTTEGTVRSVSEVAYDRSPLNVSEHGAMQRPYVLLNLRQAEQVTTEGDGTMLLCSTCYDDRVECDECDATMRCDDYYSCDECDLTLCYSCQSRDHRSHDYADPSSRYDTDRDRGMFSPRTTIRTALALPATPGTTIRSTRAIGMEVETARGRCRPVIEAEVNAVVPILAGVGTDGSVRGANPVEYRLLPLRGQWMEYAIRSMSEWCTAAGYRPDTSAGVHMHVDCSTLEAAQVYRACAALIALEDVLYAHAAASRRNCTYARAYASTAQQAIRNCLSAASSGTSFSYANVSMNSRYMSVNPQAFEGHRTLEVRVFDSAHDGVAVERYTDAAAIIAAAVDWAASTPGREWLALHGTGLGDAFGATRVLTEIAAHGGITADTLARAQARLSASMSVTPTQHFALAS